MEDDNLKANNIEAENLTINDKPTIRLNKIDAEMKKEVKEICDNLISSLSNIKSDAKGKKSTTTFAAIAWIVLTGIFVILLLLFPWKTEFADFHDINLYVYIISKISLVVIFISVLIPSLKFVKYLFDEEYNYRDSINNFIISTSIISAMIQSSNEIPQELFENLRLKKSYPDIKLDSIIEKNFKALENILSLIIDKLPKQTKA